jgi:HD superfamily phosphohydrolase
MKNKLFLILFFFSASLFSQPIFTFYGVIEEDNPLILELIDSPAFQRLKHIHQYGISYYTTHKEEYNRYEHSLGVFAILKLKGASEKEQIAGLLHDISHTVFSHVGDWLFGKEYLEKDYQNEIHLSFLEKYGIAAILNKYQIDVRDILPEAHLFPMLEKLSPALSADRIEYNFQGAYYQGFLTYDEILEALEDLKYIDGSWISSKPHLMKKLGLFSLFMTENCWGSVDNHLTSKYLALSLKAAIDEKLLTWEDIHFGYDNDIWNTLTLYPSSEVRKNMTKIANVKLQYRFVKEKEANLIIKSKFRGIDPLIIYQGKLYKLTDLDEEYRLEFLRVKDVIKKGWAILTQP